jgi:ADP-ribosylglycohydrolase
MVMLKQGADKEAIRSYVEGKYYQLDKTCEDYRTEQAGHHGREICQVSVPQAIVCFLESTDFEDCMRNCISIGGDSDTIAAIAGGLAEAYYGVPDELWTKGEKYLDDYLRSIVSEFYAKFGVN